MKLIKAITHFPLVAHNGDLMYVMDLAMWEDTLHDLQEATGGAQDDCNYIHSDLCQQHTSELLAGETDYTYYSDGADYFHETGLTLHELIEALGYGEIEFSTREFNIKLTEKFSQPPTAIRQASLVVSIRSNNILTMPNEWKVKRVIDADSDEYETLLNCNLSELKNWLECHAV